MKIGPVVCISMFECTVLWMFELPEIAKNEVADFSGQPCVTVGYFIHILYVKLILEKFQIIILVILAQNKPIRLILNNRKSKIKSGGTLISSWKWNYLYLLVSKQYPHLYAFHWMIIGSWCEIIQLSIIHVWIQRSPGKWRFRSLKSLLLAQFSTYKYRTRFIVKRKEMRIEKYLDTPIHWCN